MWRFKKQYLIFFLLSYILILQFILFHTYIIKKNHSPENIFSLQIGVRCINTGIVLNIHVYVYSFHLCSLLSCTYDNIWHTVSLISDG